MWAADSAGTMLNQPDLQEMSNYRICWYGPNKRAVIHREDCWHWVNAHNAPGAEHPMEAPLDAQVMFIEPPRDAPTGYFSTLSVVREIIRSFGWEAIDDSCVYYTD